MRSSMKIVSWVSLSCWAFLKPWVSSGVAGIADCKVCRAGDAESNGKQSNSLKQDIRSYTTCSSLLICAEVRIPCAFELGVFYSPEYEE